MFGRPNVCRALLTAFETSHFPEGQWDYPLGSLRLLISVLNWAYINCSLTSREHTNEIYLMKAVVICLSAHQAKYTRRPGLKAYTATPTPYSPVIIKKTYIPLLGPTVSVFTQTMWTSCIDYETLKAVSRVLGESTALLPRTFLARMQVM